MSRLHIELTNRCVLACPACPRTEWQSILKRPVPKQDLNYLELDMFLNCPAGDDVDTFILCGDFGDCIYYSQLFEFLRHFRESKRYVLSTNGSRRSVKFWQELASLMTPDDTIVFAIDGLEGTHDIYRKNSDWKSTMDGLEIMCASPATVKWQTIIFRYNQDSLNEIKMFAESKGAIFESQRTHRYGDPSLVPDEQHVLVEYRYNEKFNSETNFEIKPQCSCSDVIPTIGADGIYYPCDWIRNPNTFYKSALWKNKDRWLDKLHINNTTLDEARIIINDWANSIRDNSLNGKEVDVLCKMKCRAGVSHD